jgi:hypothetical protein
VRLGFWAWGWGGGIRWGGRVVGRRFRKSVSGVLVKQHEHQIFASSCRNKI